MAVTASSLAAQPSSSEPAGAEYRLIENAIRLFAEKGYDGTSIREIIEAAGVTRPVLYYYFKNKEDLFCGIIERGFAEMLSSLDEILATEADCEARLKLLIRKEFDRIEGMYDFARVMLQFFFAPPGQQLRLDRSILTQQRFDRIVEIMRRGIENSEVTGGDAHSLALVFGGIMDMHSMARIRSGEGSLSPEFGDSLVEFFMAGAKPGREPSHSLVSPFPIQEDPQVRGNQ